MSALKSREAILFGAIFALVALIATRFPGFVAPGNLVAVFTDTTPLMILAMGQMVVILTRCIDLSVAANLALTGMVCAMINVAAPDLPVAVILVIALVMGSALGAINGILVWKLNIPPIVVTLGTMTIFRGVIFLLTEGKWINAHEMSPTFTGFPRAEFLGMPVLGWIGVVIAIVMMVVMARTTLGRAVYAVGGNPHAAVYTGIDVGKTQFKAFVISGMLAGLTGYLWVARYSVAYVDIAGGFELDVVAACVIGGVSIAGGAGTVVGTLLGALFLGVVKNALPVVDVSPFWQLAISGAAIIIAVAFNAKSGRSKGRVILKSAEHAQ
ncbi:MULTISPECIES: ABC transporter permease [Halocynthiibacter]|uniref:ABC transporter permease n=1 Tax=Halocynthiibacter halioticoli TaxID=2986804 RepID=A0AAE3IXC3_9RHOB|nr:MULTISPECIES: ABC transporter permease [Halocynthiibacter]MCV6823459.1 ABC transporter permease [Halocynthiibacter halioticoli]MCW4056460.1 ABC transporter permease [Halocynthiibacter sp. SDUM655004]MDE0590574.1 ABC transporter permease [Halocynthiibacter sp. C4]